MPENTVTLVTDSEDTPLSTDEQIKYSHAKTLITNGWHDTEKGLLTIAQGLRMILEGRLYREEYPSFEAFCKDGFGDKSLSRRRAYELVNFAKLNDLLCASGAQIAPKSERSVRPLAAATYLSDQEKVDLWGQVTEGKTAPSSAEIAKVLEAKKAPYQEGDTVYLKDDESPEPVKIAEVLDKNVFRIEREDGGTYTAITEELSKEPPRASVVRQKSGNLDQLISDLELAHGRIEALEDWVRTVITSHKRRQSVLQDKLLLRGFELLGE